VAVSNATAAAVIDFPLNIALSLVHIIPITPSSRTISARFTRGRVCGPPPFNYRIALEEETPRCNDPHSRYASLVTNLSPRPCFTPTDRPILPRPARRASPIFFQKYQGSFGNQHGKFWQSDNHRYSDRAHRTIGPLQAIGLGGSLNVERL